MIDGIDERPLDESSIRRLAKIDLNLLVVFAALMQETSVSRAAERLFVGQSAVSASLKRLRALFADPLLVKVGRRMVATERAIALGLLIDKALSGIDRLAFTAPTFEPRSASGVVRLGLSDDNEVVFLPAIIAELQRLAPDIRVVARSVSHASIRESLDDGDVDLGLSVFGQLSSWHSSTHLYDQGYGCLFDAAHSRLRTRLGLADYLAARQAIVTFDGELAGKIDRVLGERGLKRRVFVGTTRFSSLPYLIRGTDLVASLPELIGRVLARTHGLAYCPLPFDVPDGKPCMAWHRRHDHDLAGRWVRSLVHATVLRTVADIRLGSRRRAGSRPGVETSRARPTRRT